MLFSLWGSIKNLSFVVVIALALSACAINDFGNDDEAATFKVVGGEIFVRGVIGDRSLDDFEGVINKYPDAKKLVLVDVPGSDDDDTNLALGRLVRELGMTTIIPEGGMVASGGTDLFLAGADRIAHKSAKMGVHSWASSSGPSGNELPRSDPEHQLYLSYYQELGIDPEFYWFTLQAAPPNDIHFMTAQEKERFKVVTQAYDRGAR